MPEEKSIVIDVRLSKGVVLALVVLLVFMVLFNYHQPAGQHAAAADGGREVTQVGGLRQFYLTKGGAPGNSALLACEPGSGYHMASLWEIADPSNLKYNTSLGYQQQDSGEGPPADISWAYGWVRTGYDSNSSTIPGRANCLNWTSPGLPTYGTVAALPSQWTAGLEDIGVWEFTYKTCNNYIRVWCIED